MLSINVRQIFSFCGLEECATHIGYPQMRGCLGGGAAEHRITRIVFGITNKERTLFFGMYAEDDYSTVNTPSFSVRKRIYR